MRQILTKLAGFVQMLVIKLLAMSKVRDVMEVYGEMKAKSEAKSSSKKEKSAFLR